MISKKYFILFIVLFVTIIVYFQYEKIKNFYYLKNLKTIKYVNNYRLDNGPYLLEDGTKIYEYNPSIFQLKNGTDIKLLRRDLLEKLVNEYEENGSIGIDPYKRFSEIIQKLNFGSPFIDHVAKKTYVKTKSNVNELLLSSNPSVEINEIEDEIDEDEYQELLKEFGNEI